MQSPISKQSVYVSDEQFKLLDQLAFDYDNNNNDYDNSIFYNDNNNEEYDEEQVQKIQLIIQQRHEEKILKIINFILCDRKYQNLVEGALEIINDSRIICTQTSSSSKRSFWNVPSASGNGKLYTCLKNYCPCRSFFDLAKSTSCKVLCKHLLAIRIGIAFNVVKINTVNDMTFVNLLTEETSRSVNTNQYHQYHHHQQQQQQQQQNQFETPSRFVKEFNLSRNNDFEER